MGISLASLPSFLFSYHSLTTIQTDYFLDLTELQTHKLATSHLNKQQEKEKKQRQTTDRPQFDVKCIWLLYQAIPYSSYSTAQLEEDNPSLCLCHDT
jgi:hypothetical protein